MKRPPIQLLLSTVLALLAGGLFTANAQNSQTRDVSGFNGISVAGSYKVYIEEGNTESLRMEGDEEVLDKIKTVVKDGTLEIYTEKKKKWWDWTAWDDNGHATIYITYTELNTLSLSGSGTLEAENELHGNSLALHVSGSGSIRAPIDASSLESSISGSGKIEVSGVTSDADIQISGSGNFSGKNLAANKVEAHISGSGNAWVNAREELDAHISGSGNVHYTGSPARKSISSSGSGKAIAGN